MIDTPSPPKESQKNNLVKEVKSAYKPRDPSGQSLTDFCSMKQQQL